MGIELGGNEMTYTIVSAVVLITAAAFLMLWKRRDTKGV